MRRLGMIIGLLIALALTAGCGASDGTTQVFGTSGTAVTSAGANTLDSTGASSIETTEGSPPPPADVSGMQEWLGSAYPGAAWLLRIQSIEYVPGEVPSSGGFHDAIVVTTDLDFETEKDLALAIGDAIACANLGLADPNDTFVLWYAGEEGYQLAGDIKEWCPSGTVAATTPSPTTPSSSMTSGESANSGIHLYRAEVEVLECGAQPPPYVYEDRLFEVLIDAEHLTYDDVEDDAPPLVWDRLGPGEFTKEATSNAGEQMAYSLTVHEWGMVYYYEVDTVPCRRIRWTRVDE